MRRLWMLALALALLVAPSLGACPNKCSGHGSCSTNDVCVCMQNWIGGDCSQRQCPFVRAWQDTAVGDNDAHYYQECASRGSCDREKGVCDCDVGFTGSGCRRLACPGDCSGHGVCDFIEELAVNSFDKRIAGKRGTKYELWDQEKIMGCKCDPGYEGHDCSKRTCPKGDDQLTPNQIEMIQVIQTASSPLHTHEGYFTYFDPYGNSFTTSMIKFDSSSLTAISDTCGRIQTALRQLPNNVLNTVTVTTIPAATTIFTRASPRSTSTTGTVGAAVTASAVADKAIRCIVKFKSEPGTTGYQHLLGCNVLPHAELGMQPKSAGETTLAATCTVDEAQVSTSSTTLALSELVECSGRGQCDYTTGVCKCYTGHMGLACERQEALV